MMKCIIKQATHPLRRPTPPHILLRAHPNDFAHHPHELGHGGRLAEAEWGSEWDGVMQGLGVV